MPEPRPSVFIGSSSEGLSVAEAIQLNLDRACEVVVWSQGVFGLNEGTLETLVMKLPVFDFAILVLTPDDLVISREQEHSAARDNVLLELGLCIGAIGRERTFAVFDRTANLKLPSDLAGVTLAEYQPHTDGNTQSALGAACTLIKGTVQNLGLRPKDQGNTYITQDSQFQVIHDLLEDIADQLIILMHETGTKLTRESSFQAGVHYEMQTRSTDSTGTYSVDNMCSRLADADLLQQSLRNEVTLTKRGHEYAKWLVERGHKADYFQSTVGGWGEPKKRSGIVDIGNDFASLRGLAPQQPSSDTDSPPATGN